MFVPRFKNAHQDFGVATIIGGSLRLQRHNWRCITCVGVLFLSACADFAWSEPDNMTPLVEADPSKSQQDIPPTEIESSPDAIDNQASPPMGASPAFLPFPIAVPSTRCTSRAVGEDIGVVPAKLFPCVGVWVIGWIEACPIFTACEGYDIFRWTVTGWQHRGFYNSLCVTEVDRSGLPRTVNDRIFTGNLDCDQESSYQTEEESGPLSRGDSGNRVQALQRRLIDLTLLNSTADGEFGIKTKNALVDFQYLMGLEPNGIASLEVFTALGMAMK